MSQEAAVKHPWLAHLTRPWVWKGMVVVYAIYIFLLISFYIFIAGRSVTYSYTISGQPSVSAGQRAAMRVGVFDIHRGRFLPATDIRVQFVRDQQVTDVFRGLTSPAGLGDVNLKVPEVAPGPGAWRVTLEPPDLEPETVDIPVEVLAPEPPDVLAMWSDAAMGVQSLKAGQARAAKPDEGTGPVRLELIPEGHVAVDGLKTLFFVQATDRLTGAPVQAQVKVTKGKGMVEGELPDVVQTNGGGLGAFGIVPIGAQEWTLSVEQTTGEGLPVVSTRRIHIKSEPTQYAMVLRDPVWSDGENLEIAVRSLHRSGALYADVYLGHGWRHGEVTGMGPQGAGVILPSEVIPRPAKGVWLARVQVYGDALQPGAAGDMRALAVPAYGLGPREVLQEVLTWAAEADVQKARAEALGRSGWLQAASERDLHAQLAYWLSLLPRDLQQPYLLKDTQQGEREELSEEKQTFRSQITTLLAVSGGLGLLLVLFLVVNNYLRVRYESRAMVEALGDEATEEALARRGFGNTAAILQLVLLFATIAMFFAAIVVLLQAL